MAQITRALILEKYKVLSTEKDSILSTKYNYVVTTPLLGMGLVRKMDLADIIKAYEVVNEYMGVAKQAAGALDIPEAILNTTNAEYLGVQISDWENDMKARVQELKNKARLVEINEKLPVLKRHLSEDDMFALDMEAIGM